MRKLLPRLRSTSFNPGPRKVLRPRFPALSAIHAPDALNCAQGGDGKSDGFNHPLGVRKSDRSACLELPNAGVSGASKKFPSPLRSWLVVTQNGYPSWKLAMTPSCQFPSVAFANRLPKRFLGTS